MCLYHVEVRTTQNDTQILNYMFISAPCQTLFLTMEEDDTIFKITCQIFNGFVIFKGRSV